MPLRLLMRQLSRTKLPGRLPREACAGHDHHLRTAVCMKTILQSPPSYVFHFPELDTLVRVEQTEAGVVIRTTRDTFTDQRKGYFLRELTAEGFLGRHAEHVGDANGVEWVVDSSWLACPATQQQQTRRFMVRLLTGALVLWVGMLIGLAVLALRQR